MATNTLMTRQSYLRKAGARRLMVDILLAALGIAAATIGLKSFLLPNGFIDGGVTGISLLMTQLATGGLSLWIIAINIPFIIDRKSTRLNSSH